MKTIKLWTIQPISWYEKLLENGFIYGDSNLSNVDKNFLAAYNWLTQQMEAKVSKKPFNDVTPIWAWYQYRGKQKLKPDLRSCHLAKGTKGVRIEFSKNETEILLSDYDLWHHPLNYWCIHDNEKQENEFDTLLETEKINFVDKEKYTFILKNKVEESWHKIFDLNYTTQYSANKKDQKSIQATFWKLSVEEIIKVDYFIAR